MQEKPVNVPEITINDYTDYLQRCHEAVSETDYFLNRGLSAQIIEKFRLGYDVEKNIITIPYNSDCKGYVHRVLWDCDNKYCKHGNEIFNVQALYSNDSDYVFVTEGQIDAMSFEEVGFSSVGLGGVNEITKLAEILRQKPSNKRLILALDNDKAGRKATGKFIELMGDMEVNQNYAVNSCLYGEYKDANEYLIGDKDGFVEKCKREVG